MNVWYTWYRSCPSMHGINLWTVLLLLITCRTLESLAFNLADASHYLDYMPAQRDGTNALIEDFRTSHIPPSHLRNRKMGIGSTQLQVEEVLANPVWPAKWPYAQEDFRPCDYARDQPANTIVQYQYSQSLIDAANVQIIPGLFRVPIRRHFILPKDKVAQMDHLDQYFTEGAKVLELFSTYESILPPGLKYGPTVGVGWSSREMISNEALDDYIEQDLTVDPFLPLADNYFDFVVVPAMFQLFQRPLDMFKEINRVLKPGGTAFIGVKLSFWGFLHQKQGRYYVQTTYLDDVMAAGSFFHYAGGFTKPEGFDLTLPELNLVGKLKDKIWPSPRQDFYACVQARKRKDSPHGSRDSLDDTPPPPGTVDGIRWKPAYGYSDATFLPSMTPYYKNFPIG